MVKWRRLKKGDKVYLSVVYKDYGRYGGYYITFPEEGDLYVPLSDLGEPKEDDSESATDN